jgi:MFS family permease
MVLTGAAFFSMWYFLTLYLQDVHGYGPLKAGLLFLPMGIFLILGAQVGSRLVNQMGPGPVVMIGLALTTGGFIWLGQLDATSTYLAGVLPGSFLTTVGVGLSFPALAAAATAGVPLFQTGLASGVLNTSRQVGGSLGLAALATAATARTNHAAAGTSHAQALTAGFDRAFLVAAGVTALAFVFAAAIPRRAPGTTPVPVEETGGPVASVATTD